MHLDAYDKKLLFELDADVRASYTQLAKRVGLSKDTIKYRMTNYLKTRLIGGFYPLIDSSKLGYYSFRVYFSFSKTTIDDEEKIIQYLINQKNVCYVMRVEGEFSAGFGYFSKSIFKYMNFLTKFKEQFSNVLVNHEGLFVELSHFDRNYLINKKRLQKQKVIFQEPCKLNVDKIDVYILQLLSENARISIVDISKKIKLTSKAIIYRINNLEKKGIILGYKPKLNLEKINYLFYKVDIYLENASVEKKIKEYLFTLPNIIHSEVVFGGSGVEFDVECQDYNEFNKIIQKIKNEFGKEICEIKHYRSTEVYKTDYMPSM